MSLKLRYASLLLFICLVICGFTWLIASTVADGKYLMAIGLALVLYGCTFLMGKKFRKVFFLLSTIKLLKDANGVAPVSKVEQHINRAGKDEQLPGVIIKLLIDEGIIQHQGDQIILTGE